MSIEEPFDGFVFDPQQASNVIEASGTYFFDPSNPTEEGFLSISFINNTTHWVSTVIQVVGGPQIYDSGHFDHGLGPDTQMLAGPYVNQALQIHRWAPDAFGFPGDGGGNVRFTVPDVGSLAIVITVVDR